MRARSGLDRFSMKIELFREINGSFLLNERGDPFFHYINFNGIRSSTIYRDFKKS